MATQAAISRTMSRFKVQRRHRQEIRRSKGGGGGDRSATMVEHGACVHALGLGHHRHTYKYLSASDLSLNHLIARPCFTLDAPTRNMPASILFSENSPGVFRYVPCFLPLRVLRDRPKQTSTRQNLQHCFKINSSNSQLTSLEYFL